MLSALRLCDITKKLERCLPCSFSVINKFTLLQADSERARIKTKYSEWNKSEINSKYVWAGMDRWGVGPRKINNGGRTDMFIMYSEEKAEILRKNVGIHVPVQVSGTKNKILILMLLPNFSRQRSMSRGMFRFNC